MSCKCAVFAYLYVLTALLLAIPFALVVQRFPCVYIAVETDGKPRTTGTLLKQTIHSIVPPASGKTRYGRQYPVGLDCLVRGKEHFGTPVVHCCSVVRYNPHYSLQIHSNSTC